MFYMHDIGWGWWLVMSIGMLAFWALVIYAVVWLIRGGQNVQQQDQAPPKSETPEEILKRRLARGEISIEEYRRLLDALKDEASRRSMAA